MCYPKKLLPREDDVIISPETIIDFCLVRETSEDFYSTEFKDVPVEAKSKKLVGEGISSTDVFELSLNLFGEYNLDTIGIKINNKDYYNPWTPGTTAVSANDISYSKIEAFPVFLLAEELYQYQYSFEDSSGKTETIILSFEHKPTIANYWHFQLFSDKNNERLQRNSRSTKARRIAKVLLEIIITKALCNKDDVKEYHRNAC